MTTDRADALAERIYNEYVRPGAQAVPFADMRGWVRDALEAAERAGRDADDLATIERLTAERDAALAPPPEAKDLWASIFGNTYTPATWGKCEAIHPIRIAQAVRIAQQRAPECADVIAMLIWWRALDAQTAAFVQQEMRKERDELQATFDAQEAANERAVARWQEATGRRLVWPDGADLRVWLMQQVDALEKERDAARAALSDAPRELKSSQELRAHAENLATAFERTVIERDAARRERDALQSVLAQDNLAVALARVLAERDAMRRERDAAQSALDGASTP